MTIATTRAEHVAHTRNAVVREAAQLVAEGNAPLALWSLRWHTEHLAALSDSTVTLAEAWRAYEGVRERLEARA